jgi:hypothetical protein
MLTHRTGIVDLAAAVQAILGAVGFAFVMLAVLAAMAGVGHCDQAPAPTPAVTFRVVPEILTGFVSTAAGSQQYVGMRVTTTRSTTDAGQQLRIEGATHNVSDAKDPRSWYSVDLIASAWRYVVADVALVGTVGSSIPMEGGRPAAAKAYPLLAGALVGWMPRDHSFRVAAGAGICQEAGPGVHAIGSARITGPGLGPAGSAIVADGCWGKTSLVRVNVAVGLR